MDDLCSSPGTACKKYQYKYAKLETLLDYRFKDKSLICRALTHRSVERGSGDNYESLETVGDSVLGAVVCKYIYENVQGATPRQLTALRSKVVSNASLARLGRLIHLETFIKDLPHNIRRTGGMDSVLSDVLEAVFGAIWLDSTSFEVVESTFLCTFKNHIALDPCRSDLMDPKTRLQMWCQKRHKQPPTYVVEEETGPSHAKKFVVCVEHPRDRRVRGRGVGKGKKRAQQIAASSALRNIENASSVVSSSPQCAISYLSAALSTNICSTSPQVK
jgi:ribonuclease-3